MCECWGVFIIHANKVMLFISFNTSAVEYSSDNRREIQDVEVYSGGYDFLLWKLFTDVNMSCGALKQALGGPA